MSPATVAGGRFFLFESTKPRPRPMTSTSSSSMSSLWHKTVDFTSDWRHLLIPLSGFILFAPGFLVTSPAFDFFNGKSTPLVVFIGLVLLGAWVVGLNMLLQSHHEKEHPNTTSNYSDGFGRLLEQKSSTSPGGNLSARGVY